MNRKSLVAASVVVLASCLAVATPYLAEQPPVFTHAPHIEAGAGCGDCHVAGKDRDLPEINTDACGGCHDPYDRWQLKARPARLAASFPHKRHVDALECAKCHKPDALDSVVQSKPVMVQADCVACHADNGVEVKEGNCAACHGVNLRVKEPGSHDSGWMLRHGKAATYDVFERHGTDCRTCHRADACVSCHQNRKPRSHTALWRIRTHGVAAEFDRDACATCHEPSSCTSCHANSRPLSHRGGWTSMHATAASMESEQKCAVCHGASHCTKCHGK
jgi:hypothetical protein